MNSIHPTARFGKLAAAIALALCMASPASAAQDNTVRDPAARSFVDMVKSVPLVPTDLRDSDMLAKVTEAVKYIKRLDLPQAHFAVNEALQLDPRNSHLHFLNGFVYHLQARQGDTQKGEMAMEGYEQALRIDPNHRGAHEYLGQAYVQTKQLDKAKEQLASLETICGTQCEEYVDLKKSIAKFKK